MNFTQEAQGFPRASFYVQNREVVTVARPLDYKTVEELQAAIDRYFDACEGKVLTDDDGNVLTDKKGRPIVVGAKPPTVTGLALALGFNSRQALLNYHTMVILTKMNIIMVYIHILIF